jgi:Tfp pilus assembly protein PilZ
MSDNDPDRRRGERLNINEEFESVGAIYVSDLSEHGVFVHTSDQLPIGTTVELRFSVLLDDPVVIQGLGKVVRHQSDPPGMGVEFGPLSPAMVLRIQDVIARQRPRDSGPPLAGGGVESQELKTREFGTRPVSEDEFDMAKTGTFAPVDAPMSLGDEDIEDLEDTKTRPHKAVVTPIVDDDDSED